MPEKLEFKVSTYAGYNKPGHGRHATELVMAVIGEAGAIVWRMATGIYPFGAYDNTLDHNITSLYKVDIGTPNDMGVSAHSEMTLTNVVEDYDITDSCEFLSGRACVCTMHTGLKGSTLFPAFACEGFDGVEKILTEIYKEHYNEG